MRNYAAVRDFPAICLTAAFFLGMIAGDLSFMALRICCEAMPGVSQCFFRRQDSAIVIGTWLRILTTPIIPPS